MVENQRIISLIVLCSLVLTGCFAAPPSVEQSPVIDPVITLSVNDSSPTTLDPPADEFCSADDFLTDNIGAGWQWIDPSGKDQFNLISNPGKLRILENTGSADLNVGNTTAPRLTQSISGDFEITTSLNVNPTESYQSAGLVLWIDNANFIWIGRSVYGVIGHHFVLNGTGDSLDPPEINYADNSIYFKIARVQKTVSTYYSIDGKNWIKTGSLNNPTMKEIVSAGVFVINNWQQNSFYADFDYVRVSCTSPTSSVQIVAPHPSSANISNGHTAPMRKTVFSIAYVDENPIYDPTEHQNELISGLRQASIWHGYKNPIGQPALEYSTYDNKVIYLYEAPPYRSDTGQFDYAAVYERFKLCDKIQAGEVDEVWVWESGSGHAWEWVTNGPSWSWLNDSNVPNCGKTVTSMNFNYQREIDVAYESFSHRIEGAIMINIPCVFYTKTWPWTNWPSQCAGIISDRYGFVARAFSGNDQVSVCGDAHHPPNILDTREYVYDDQTFVNSSCEDWQMDGTGHIKSFNCEEWGCTHWGYHIWWMQNLPGIDNNNHDQNGTLMPNWWEFLF